MDEGQVWLHVNSRTESYAGKRVAIEEKYFKQLYSVKRRKATNLVHPSINSIWW